jgi:two-component system, sensor histidine kinase and response regulator
MKKSSGRKAIKRVAKAKKVKRSIKTNKKIITRPSTVVIQKIQQLELLSGLAHDLRTPMNGMYGMAQLLKAQLNDAKYDSYFENIKTSKQALERLIDDALGYIKLKAGKVEIISEPFNFRQLIQDVVMMLTHQANEKNIKLLVNYPDDIPRHVFNDPHCLRRILMNLINNAVKYTDQGAVSVSVACVKTNNKKATLKLMIEDTGIGIPRDKLNFVFERFSRVENVKEKYQGTGLGLAIVKGMVEKLSGTIYVESEVNKGSTFTCVLPFKLQQVTTRPSLWQRRYADVRVLVVGEHKLLCERILKNLSARDGSVTTSKVLLATLATAQQKNKPYQIVLMDDEAGNVHELARQIHSDDNTQSPMLILLAKPGTLIDVEAAQEAGFFGRLIKPVQPTELTDGLTRLWQKWQAQRAGTIIERLKQYPPKVLLVEDDAVSSCFATTVLQTLNCQVEKISNAKEALNKLTQHYDIIFTDLGLPDMSGIELAKEIRRKEGSDYPTPIIALTGHILEEDKQKCLSAGMNGFLGKPLEQAELEVMLVKWVLNARLEREDFLAA